MLRVTIIENENKTSTSCCGRLRDCRGSKTIEIVPGVLTKTPYRFEDDLNRNARDIVAFVCRDLRGK